MRSYISNSKVILFPANSTNELKAITALDTAYRYVTVFEDVVMISFSNSYTNEEFERDVNELIERTRKVLTELSIPFKEIEMKF